LFLEPELQRGAFFFMEPEIIYCCFLSYIEQHSLLRPLELQGAAFFTAATGAARNSILFLLARAPKDLLHIAGSGATKKKPRLGWS
jgi:hypothetical protein